MFTQKSFVLAKVETTSGTDITPVVATDAIEAFDIELTTKADMKERGPGHADRSLYSEIRGKTAMELKFKIELKASGTAGTAPRLGPLLKACDRLETTVAVTSVTYSMALVSQTCTIYVNIDGILHKLVGCAGDVEIDLTSGELPWAIFTMSGVYAMPTDSPITAPTFDTSVARIVKGTTFTFGSYAAIAEKVSLKFGNTVVERPSMNATEGILAYMVGNRKPSGIMTCELVIRATANADFATYFDAGTTKALSFVNGGSAGNIITITAPVCVLRAPKYGDRDGIRTVDIEFQMARNTGNDEMVIAMT